MIEVTTALVRQYRAGRLGAEALAEVLAELLVDGAEAPERPVAVPDEPELRPGAIGWTPPSGRYAVPAPAKPKRGSIIDRMRRFAAARPEEPGEPMYNGVPEAALAATMPEFYRDWKRGGVDDDDMNEQIARRRGLIDDWLDGRDNPALAAVCECGAAATTTIGSMPYCDVHADAARGIVKPAEPAAADQR
jgi:hypothetical protein